YDTVVRAALALQSQPAPRLIILLTDGRNYPSPFSNTVSLKDAIAAARSAEVSVYSIGVAGPQLTPGPLRALARATGGTYYAAARGDAQLAAAYARIATELRRTWTLEYFTAKRPGDKLRLNVQAGRVGAATAAVTIPASKAAGPSKSGW